MAAFSQVTATSARKPCAIATLAPAAWHHEWPDRPAQSVAVGLSLLSEAQCATCRAEAEKAADELHPRGGDGWLDAHNDALLRWAVGLSMCNPNDASLPFLAAQEDNLGQALTPDAIRHLWDELERARIASSPVRVPATDEDLAALAGLLTDGTVGHLASPQALRIRKLATFMLDELSIVSEMMGGDDE